jgi:dihydroorotase
MGFELMMEHLHHAGVTTNSESGVSDITAFYDTFAAMEKHGIGK